MGNIRPAAHDFRVAVIGVEHRQITVRRAHQRLLIPELAVYGDQAGYEVGMEIPAGRRPHFREQREFVVPIGQSPLHLHLAFGRSQPVSRHAAQEQPRGLLVDVSRRSGTDGIEVFAAILLGFLVGSRLNPAGQPHHPVVGRKALHTAVLQQGFRLGEQQIERIAAFAAVADTIRSKRTEGGADSEAVAGIAGFAEKPSGIVHFVFRRIRQILQIQQEGDTFGSILLRFAFGPERINQPVFRRKRRAGEDISYEQQCPQKFFHGGKGL